jgi:hypothetical protein
MRQQLLFAIFSLFMLKSAFAAEDIQQVTNQSDTTMASASQIVEQTKPLRFLLGAGLTFGGDTLATVSYTDGSTDSITAGGGLMFYGGLDYRLDDAISLQGNLGLHLDTTKPASNGEVTFGRLPLELLAYYHLSDAFRLGGGIRIVSGAKLKGSGIAGNAYQKFDNTIGMIIEGEYLLHRTFGIKLRHVSERYQPSGSPVSYSGSHFGVLANLYF